MHKTIGFDTIWNMLTYLQYHMAKTIIKMFGTKNMKITDADAFYKLRFFG